MSISIASWVGIAVCLLGSVNTAVAQTKASLDSVVRAAAARFSGTVGIYVKHLGSGAESAFNGDRRFEGASTIKIALLVHAYQLSEQGKLDLDERYTVRATDFRGGTGILRMHAPGATLRVRDLLTQMIVTSDNTATDIIIARLGGKEAVNDWLRQSGYSALRVNRTVDEMFRTYYAMINPDFGRLSPEDVFAISSDLPAFTEPRKELIARFRTDAAAADLGARTRARMLSEEGWISTASAREMGKLLEGIERCTVASRQSCNEMLRILRGQQLNEKLPRYLVHPVAHKTGESGVASNDVGIVYTPSGPLVLAIYNFGFVGHPSVANERIARAAESIVDWFNGVPKGMRGEES